MGLFFGKSTKADIDRQIANKQAEIERLKADVEKAKGTIANAKAYNKKWGGERIGYSSVQNQMAGYKVQIANLKAQIADLRAEKKRL